GRERPRRAGRGRAAGHGIAERGARRVLAERRGGADAPAGGSGRHIHLVLENDDNAARLLDPRAAAPAGRFRAQWNDDFHHAWHVLLSGEAHGYYRDHSEAPLARIARMLAAGFDYQGERSAHREGRPRGEPSGALA